ncbi:MAG: Arc family DNA-binding protein [Proteobacteria bacterium]|nr:Arc family DNA-binding protein [Pseudomonadota bacterium]MBU1388646.1 Arc family DNA-binding protein [Pseudomonadota bacterium]MBU1544885.1 Arc family DNA-binding protein [Pseudomonadota bacterium]MBU2429341.1 Arc family DNA-binding protein [Pseudomonadota bacterium]MBU2479471.1 Arc family DNA-binding protein [Pseudomonadota bacterium]
MATITLKNIPDVTYETLKQLAAENHRSINSEVIFLIEKATKSKIIDADQHLATAKKMREKTSEYFLDETRLDQIRNEGRP